MRTLIFVSSVIAVASGCGTKPEQPEMGTVVGRVTIAGKPVTNATIRFASIEHADIDRLANIGPDGAFEVKAYNGPGLPPGKYRVAVTPGRIPEQDAMLSIDKEPAKPASPTVSIPEKYVDIETSGLTIDVMTGENSAFTIDLVP